MITIISYDKQKYKNLSSTQPVIKPQKKSPNTKMQTSVSNFVVVFWLAGGLLSKIDCCLLTAVLNWLLVMRKKKWFSKVWNFFLYFLSDGGTVETSDWSHFGRVEFFMWKYGLRCRYHITQNTWKYTGTVLYLVQKAFLLISETFNNEISNTQSTKN